MLTPLAIDPAHPFPQLLNKSLNLIVRLEMRRTARCSSIWPWCRSRASCRAWSNCRARMAGRIMSILGHLIGHYLADLFPGTKILGYWPFRVTRNSELYIDEEEAANLLKAVENELHNRRKGDAVRLEVEHDCPQHIRDALLKTLRLTEDDLYLIDGPLNPTRLMALYEGDHSPELRDPPFVAPIAAALREQAGHCSRPFASATFLLHHPYENFNSVVDFLEQAAADPDVLAIKQTLYRTGGDPRIVGALENAVNNGKQVTAVVELRARFDEANNIQWARQLEEAGVHVVYGLVGYKIHAKSLPGRAARRPSHPPLRSSGHRQLQSDHGATLHRHRPVHLPAGFRRRRHQFLQSAHRHLPVSSRCANCWSRRLNCTSACCKLIERETENARKRPARADHRQS